MMEQFLSVPLTKMMYGWSKWGGKTDGLGTFATAPDTKWACQMCGEYQAWSLPRYMIPFDDSWREFIKVCSNCKRKSIIRRLRYVQELLKVIKGID